MSGLIYPNPLELQKGEEEYSLGIFKINRLRWANIPIKASGTYHCYDANNLNISGSKILVVVSSKILYGFIYLIIGVKDLLELKVIYIFINRL